MFTMPDHLKSECNQSPCYECQEPVKQHESGRWFITIGHPGFNSIANNGRGYSSKEGAVAAFSRLLKERSQFRKIFSEIGTK